MSTMKFVVAFVAFFAFVSTSSAFVNIHVSAGNGQETYNMEAGASPSISGDAAFASYSTTFDMSGAFPETTRNDFAIGASDFYDEAYDYAYTNHVVGHHVTGTYFSRHPTFGTFSTSFEADF